MDQVKDYRMRAEQARKAAETAVDATVKEGFLKTAEEYECMADRLSRGDK